jgi:hypothetical protein
MEHFLRQNKAFLTLYNWHRHCFVQPAPLAGVISGAAMQAKPAEIAVCLIARQVSHWKKSWLFLDYVQKRGG